MAKQRLPITVWNGFLLIGLHVGGAVSLPAQQHTAPFVRWEPSASSATGMQGWRPLDGDSSSLGDYRYEGLVFGGVIFGALGVWAGSQISAACPLEPGSPCDSGDKVGQAIGLGLVGAAIGGGLGYLVGRLSPKRASPVYPTEPPAPQFGNVPDSVRTRTGYQHWRGGAIGAALGFAAGAVTAALVGTECDDCGSQPSTAEAALTVGLVGAGAGGVLGFLVGLSSPRYAWIPRVAQ